MNDFKEQANLLLQYRLTLIEKENAKENFIVRFDFNDGKHSSS